MISKERREELREALRAMADGDGLMIPYRDAVALLDKADELDALKAENERLRGQVEDLQAKGIHTCHDQCQRVECVLRRRAERLEAALRERDGGPWPEPEQIGRIDSPSSGG